MNPEKLENFEHAFGDSSAGCVRTCECGRTYYDPGGGWDWEEGELEKLESDPNAIGLHYAPGDISFEGRRLVDACDCWHERAKKIMAFIDGHAHKIAAYLTKEKERKQRIADSAPVVR